MGVLGLWGLGVEGFWLEGLGGSSEDVTVVGFRVYDVGFSVQSPGHLVHTKPESLK